MKHGCWASRVGAVCLSVPLLFFRTASAGCYEVYAPEHTDCGNFEKFGFTCKDYPKGWCAVDAGSLTVDSSCVTAYGAGYVVDEETGRCTGTTLFSLGKGYYLRNVDLTTPFSSLTQGESVLSLSDDCLTSSPVSSQSSYIETYDNTYSFANSFSFSNDASVSATTSTFTASTTIKNSFSQSSTRNTDYASAILRTSNLAATYTLKSSCFAQQSSFVSEALTQFKALPSGIESTLIGKKNSAHSVSSSGTWSAYEEFFNTWGSHVVTTVQAGALLKIYSTASSSTTTTAEDCSNSICASGGVAVVNVSECADWSSSKDTSTSTKSTSILAQTYGGDSQLGSLLVSSRTGQVTGTGSSLTDFLNSASTSTPMQLSYTPIWELFMKVFPVTESPNYWARANVMQKYYEHYLADYSTLAPDLCVFRYSYFTSGSSGHDHKYIKTIDGITNNDDCRTECTKVSNCAGFDFREGESECQLVASTQYLRINTNYDSGYKADCGTKKESSMGGYEVLKTGSGSTLELEVVPCKYPIATKDQCEQCGNYWKTETLKDYSSCAFWDCSSYTLGYCCSNDMALLPNDATECS